MALDTIPPVTTKKSIQENKMDKNHEGNQYFLAFIGPKNPPPLYSQVVEFASSHKTQMGSSFNTGPSKLFFLLLSVIRV